MSREVYSYSTEHVHDDCIGFIVATARDVDSRLGLELRVIRELVAVVALGRTDLAQERVGRMLKEIAHYRPVVDRVIALMLSSCPVLRRRDIIGVIRKALGSRSQLAKHYDIEVIDALPKSRVYALIDSSLFRRAFDEIIANACDTLADGGVVTVTCRVVSDQIVVCIGDNGPGIRPEHLPRVLKPFFTTKSGRAGLGLAIAQKYLLLHGGGIDIENASSCGTDVRMALPLPKNAVRLSEDACCLLGGGELKLIGGFVHEFKNALSTVALNLGLMLEDYAGFQCATSDALCQSVRRAMDTCWMIQAGFNCLVRWSRIDCHRESECDVVDCMERVLEFYSGMFICEEILVCRKYSLFAHVPLDRDDLEHAVFEVILNARLAMCNGGTIHVSVHGTEECAVIEISDNGNGLDPGIRNELFRIRWLESRRCQSGLATVGRIVSAYGGRVNIESELGVGTSVVLCLPCVRTIEMG